MYTVLGLLACLLHTWYRNEAKEVYLYMYTHAQCDE